MRIGVIAGSGQFPIIFSKKVKQNGESVYALGLVDETDSTISAVVDKFKWVDLGQVQQMIHYFKQHGVKQAVMLGAVDKTRIFTDIKPDMKAIAIVSRMDHTQDDALLRSFAREMEAEGIKILAPTEFLPELIATKGCWTKRGPTSAEMADIKFGHLVSKRLGDLDIGQSVVVGGGSVLALEAIDGTDATIKRGGCLSKGQAVVVKTSKPGQDLRFDMPAAGVQTIQVMKEAGIPVLAIEAGKTVVFDKDEMIAFANENNMTIFAIENDL